MIALFAHSLDPHSNSFSKSLAECLSLAHFQREDLAASQRCEGRVRAKRLSDTCRKSIFSEDSLIWWSRSSNSSNYNTAGQQCHLEGQDDGVLGSLKCALTHSDGRFSCARLAGNQHGPASNVAIFDHL